jgi:hypothetical protein
LPAANSPPALVPRLIGFAQQLEIIVWRPALRYPIAGAGELVHLAIVGEEVPTSGARLTPAAAQRKLWWRKGIAAQTLASDGDSISNPRRPITRIGISIPAIGREVAMKRTCLVGAFLLILCMLPGCSTTTDFGIKGGQGVDFDPLAPLGGGSAFGVANDRQFMNGDPQDCRTHH